MLSSVFGRRLIESPALNCSVVAPLLIKIKQRSG